MRILQSGDIRAVKIIQNNNVDPDTHLRLSRFVFPFEKDGAILLKHTLTKRVYLLSREERNALKGGVPPMEIRDELARYRFLVEPDYDETSRYTLVRSLLHIMEKKKTGIESYTILPTTGCNARCVYCYEEEWRSETMSPEIADAASDFICQTKCDGKIRLDWFGGEPLCGAGIISSICKNLKNRGVEFYSTIITNGTLFTPGLVQEATELWNLKRAQVSMDGAREDYTLRKNYARPEQFNYDVAMSAVELLSKAGVKVFVRCNYDAGNIGRVKVFFDDCKTRFAGHENISVYLEQLFQASGPEENAELFRASAKEADYLDELGLSSTERVGQRLKTHYCMADSGRSVIIDPAGRLHVCEHDIEGEPLGTVSDASFTWHSVDAEIAEECRECCFLPDCTPFRKVRCPLKIAACKTQMAVRTERSLTTLLAQARSDTREADTTSESDCP